MSQVIENGRRFAAVRSALEQQSKFDVVSVTSSPRLDQRKNRHYLDTRIVVVPTSNTKDDIPTLTAGLLTDMQPIFRHEQEQGKVRTFDTLGENRFRPITVEVFPDKKSAQEALQ